MAEAFPIGERFDVAVVGGGMVGAALACALARDGVRLALIDPRGPQREWPAGEIDIRVSALSRASQRLLARLDAWERIAELGVCPYQEMHVWDSGGSGSIHFDCAEIGESDLGHIVENRITQRALWERLASLQEAAVLCPSQLETLERVEGGWVVGLSGGTAIEARLVVGADGARSVVREHAGIEYRGRDYAQHALVANVRTEWPHGATAWQRFLPSGPLAFLPLYDGRCSIVWSTTPGRARQLLGLDPAAFCAELLEASEGVLGRVLDVGPRAAFPLALRYAERYVMAGLALVGDAAHRVHPLAGQGVNLGFLDAAELAAVVGAARAAGRDIGGLATLRRYERARKGANLAMLAAMDGFERLFGAGALVPRMLRNFGLGAVDRLTPVKHVFMRQALGLVGELPPLARPGADCGDVKDC